MADSTLDILRQDALQQRVKGFAGGNRIHWAMKDIALIRDYVMSAEPERIIRATQPVETKFSAPDFDKAALAKMGMDERVKAIIAPEGQHPTVWLSSRSAPSLGSRWRHQQYGKRGLHRLRKILPGARYARLQ